jgi:hypothetical protein
LGAVLSVLSACEESPRATRGDEPGVSDAGVEDVVGIDVVGDTAGQNQTPEDDIFDQTVVPVYRLQFADDDWRAELDALVPADICTARGTLKATLSYENPHTGQTEVYPDVEVRWRGQSALKSNSRLGFKVAFDGVGLEDRRFHGEKKINLEGREGDPTFVAQGAGYHLAELLGLPAPREAHAVVYANDVYLGLFPLSEEPDDQPFIDAHFGGMAGDLY